MTAEVDFLLAQFASVVDSVAADYSITNQDGTTDPVSLDRIDRDDSKILEGNIRDRAAELQQGCYVGVTLADRSTEPAGTTYENRIETIVGVRVEGLHHDEYGHVDSDGTDGVPFDELVGRLRRAALADRCYPDVGRANTTYQTLFIQNEAPDLAAYSDYYRYDFEIRFKGYEDLP